MNDHRLCRRDSRFLLLAGPCIAAAALCAAGGCQTGDPTRAGLEHREVRVEPVYNIGQVPLDDSPVQGQGGAFARARDLQ